MPAVCGRPYDAPRPRIMVYGGDVKQLHPWIGDAYAGFSVIDARNAIYLGDAIEVLHSFGGWQLHDNYFGRPGDTDLVTGKVYTALAQYSISIGQLLWHPQAFWGQGPDLILNVFGMYNRVDLDVAAGANPLFNGIKKAKGGIEMTYLPLEWFGVGFRGDVVRPDLDNSGTNFAVFSPRLLFRTAFVTHEQIMIQYSRYFVEEASGACSRTTSSRARDSSWASTRMQRRLQRSSGSKRQDTRTRTTMKTQAKLLVGTLSMGLLAVAGCLSPPPGSGQGPAPGSAASIGGAPTAAQAGGPAELAPAAAAPSAPSAPAVAGAPIGTTGFKECSAEGVIDDGEDGNNQNMPNDNRGGYWYTFRDKKGTTIDPVAGEDGGTFAMSEGGHGSQFAARFHGKIGTGAPLFGGMGMNFVDPKAMYDSSKYAGISFWAKKAENSTGKVRLKIPDVNTDPEGGRVHGVLQ